MKRSILTILVALFALGCASTKTGEKAVDGAVLSYREYVRQARSFKMIEIKGTAEKPATFTMSGETIAVSSSLPPLSIMGSDETKKTLIESLASVGRMALGAWAAIEMADQINGATSNTTTNNYAPVP